VTPTSATRGPTLSSSAAELLVDERGDTWVLDGERRCTGEGL